MADRGALTSFSISLLCRSGIFIDVKK